MTNADCVKVFAPGRICLFGEHQDFLGLPVIAGAIDLGIEISGVPRKDTVFHFEMPDVGQRDEFDGAEELRYSHQRDYLRAAVNLLRRRGLNVTRGYDCTVRGTLPVGAGAGGSSALVVAWITFLLATQAASNNPHTRMRATPEEIAAYAYQAEVAEFGEPGGMMDHFTAALGGLLYMQFTDPPIIERLPAQLDGLVLGDTLVPKETVGTLRESRKAAVSGFQMLAQHVDTFDIKQTPFEKAEPFLPQMPPEMSRRVRAHFVNRDLCSDARAMLKSRSFDRRRLGEMLVEHHRQLAEGIGVSHPMLDTLLNASLVAGALGGKLNGSGRGGTMFAYAPGRQQEVKAAIDRAGGRACVTTISTGVTVQTPQPGHRSSEGHPDQSQTLPPE